MILSLANQLSFQQKTYVLLWPFVVINLIYIEKTSNTNLQILFIGGLSLVLFGSTNLNSAIGLHIFYTVMLHFIMAIHQR